MSTSNKGEGKTRRKILCSPEGFAFSFGKQGGLDVFSYFEERLKRKKAMNAVMLSFILLATMFVASGISNVVSVTNGIDSYLDKAGIGDYVVISMGTDSGAALDEMLRTEEKVIEYRTEPVVWGDKSNPQGCGRKRTGG